MEKCTETDEIRISLSFFLNVGRRIAAFQFSLGHKIPGAPVHRLMQYLHLSAALFCYNISKQFTTTALYVRLFASLDIRTKHYIFH
jgi:hypothetical protein